MKNNKKNKGNKSKELDHIQLKKGQLIKIDGLPFWLDADTVVRGRMANFRLVRSFAIKKINP